LRIKQIEHDQGVVAEVLGETASERLEIQVDGESVVSAAISELGEAYESALESALRTDPEVVVADSIIVT
jgi:hypothetical protein